MRLLKTRPDVTLFVPRAVVPGEPFELTVVLDCPEPIEIDGVDVSVRGTIRAYSSDQPPTAIGRADLHLCDKRELAAGRYTLPGRVRLGAGMPGSYRGRGFCVEWEAKVHVDVPWWLDRRATFEVPVAYRAPAPGPQARTAWASAAGGPRGTKPYLEVSLDSSALTPGRDVEGAVALFNTTHRNYRHIEISLVCHCGPRARPTRHVAARWTVPSEGLGEGEPRRFKLRLPSNLRPTFDAWDWIASWTLEVAGSVPAQFDPVARVPLHIDHQRSGDATPGRAPPAVGNERLEALWSHVANELGRTYEAGTLRGALGPRSSWEIRREVDPDQGILAVGVVQIVDVGIGLRVEGRGRKARLRGLDARQDAVLESTLGPLARAAELVEASAEALVFESQGEPDAEGLKRLDTHARLLAKAWDEVQTTLAPPASLEHRLNEWQRLADSLGARLDPLGLRVRLARGQLEARVQPQFDDAGAPVRTRIEVRTPADTFDGKERGIWQGDSLPDGELHVRTWAHGAHAAGVANDTLWTHLDAEPADLRALAERVERMLELAAKAIGERGPYR